MLDACCIFGCVIKGISQMVSFYFDAKSVHVIQTSPTIIIIIIVKSFKKQTKNKNECPILKLMIDAVAPS